MADVLPRKWMAINMDGDDFRILYEDEVEIYSVGVISVGVIGNR